MTKTFTVYTDALTTEPTASNRSRTTTRVPKEAPPSETNSNPALGAQTTESAEAVSGSPTTRALSRDPEGIMRLILPVLCLKLCVLLSSTAYR